MAEEDLVRRAGTAVEETVALVEAARENCAKAAALCERRRSIRSQLEDECAAVRDGIDRLQSISVLAHRHINRVDAIRRANGYQSAT